MTAAEYFCQLSGRGSKPGLERIKGLLSLLGNPQNELKIIHVAGTNGKGSVCRMLESILSAAGYRVGLFTSPYITTPFECLRVNREEISPSDFYGLCEEIRNAEPKTDEPPTEFEALTAMAFLYFKEQNCDVVITECGLGGRLDATNVSERPLLSVITDVALDHMEYLGDTIEKIAAEKSGIIKDGRPVVFGGTDSDAIRVIQDVCALKGAPLKQVEYKDLKIEHCSLDGTCFDFGLYKDLSLPLLGVYQPRNAAIALTAADVLRDDGLDIPEKAVRDGLSRAENPGRFEILSREPIVIYDGAHNPQGMEAAAKSLETYFGDKKAVLLMGVMGDKEYEKMTEIIAPHTDSVYTITPNNPRSLPGFELASRFEPGRISAESCGSIEEGYKKALNAAQNKKLPLIILGSLYFYKDIIRLI